MFDKMNAQHNKTLTERQRRIYDFLRTNRTGVLASVDANGEPHGVVIYYTIDKNFKVSFLTRAGTKKYDNIRRHNHVVLVVYDAQAQTSAQILGKAIEVRDSTTVNTVAEAVFLGGITTGENVILPVAKLEAGEYVAYSIIPDQIRLAVYAQPNVTEPGNVFESIESFELHDGAV